MQTTFPRPASSPLSDGCQRGARSPLTKRPLLIACVPLVLAACGAEAPLASEAGSEGASHSADRGEDAPSKTSGERPSEPVAELSRELQEALAREALAPGHEPSIYPAAPYGFVEGSTVPNIDFLGWSEPTQVNYDVGQLESIDLASFYDPGGTKGVELLLVSAVAVWCSVCQVEYLELRDDAIYDSFKDRGLEMLGVLFEDADALPARYDDLVTWTRVFEVNFPFVLDPGFKMGAFFDRSATPMNMLVDARTMQIMVALTGYNPEIYELIDRELTNRGR